jgi:hypothetical protein
MDITGADFCTTLFHQLQHPPLFLVHRLHQPAQLSHLRPLSRCKP